MHIGIDRHEGHIQRSFLAIAEHHGAQAIAQILHRHGLVLVGDQGDLAHPQIDSRYLPYHAHIVRHDLARFHVV